MTMTSSRRGDQDMVMRMAKVEKYPPLPNPFSFSSPPPPYQPLLSTTTSSQRTADPCRNMDDSLHLVRLRMVMLCVPKLCPCHLSIRQKTVNIDEFLCPLPFPVSPLLAPPLNHAHPVAPQNLSHSPPPF